MILDGEFSRDWTSERYSLQSMSTDWMFAQSGTLNKSTSRLSTHWRRGKGGVLEGVVSEDMFTKGVAGRAPGGSLYISADLNPHDRLGDPEWIASATHQHTSLRRIFDGLHPGCGNLVGYALEARSE